MLKHLTLAALLLGAASSLATAIPTGQTTLCRVEARSSPPVWLDKVLTIRQLPGCQGVAHIRFASKLGGSLPDNPPGRYSLYPNEQIRRDVPAWWWVEWEDQSGRWWRVPERRTGGP